MHVVPGSSVVVPVIVEGLPAKIEALGRRWLRKREFHLTAVSAATLQNAGSARVDLWDLAIEVLSNRSLGVITATEEVRRVRNPQEPDLETLIVMARAPGLAPLYQDLSRAFGVELSPPPAHVTVYSSDPGRGIGIDDATELSERAPELSSVEQQQARAAMRFSEVFG